MTCWHWYQGHLYIEVQAAILSPLLHLFLIIFAFVSSPECMKKPTIIGHMGGKTAYAFIRLLNFRIVEHLDECDKVLHEKLWAIIHEIFLLTALSMQRSTVHFHAEDHSHINRLWIHFGFSNLNEPWLFSYLEMWKWNWFGLFCLIYDCRPTAIL